MRLMRPTHARDGRLQHTFDVADRTATNRHPREAHAWHQVDLARAKPTETCLQPNTPTTTTKEKGKRGRKAKAKAMAMVVTAMRRVARGTRALWVAMEPTVVEMLLAIEPPT
jgi:hypothetical protein